MDIQGYFTAKGLALSAKLLSGTTLKVTRVAAGSGNTAKPASAAALPQIKQTLAVNTPSHRGNIAVIPATLVAAQAQTDYTLTELGVYANDPDEGEILYKVYKLSDPVDITAGSSMVLRFYLEETVSQDLAVTVACSPAGLITEGDFVPVRDRVTAVNSTQKNVYLDAADLPDYLVGLPRLLTEWIIIHVSGTLTEPLVISKFYGCGRLWIQADAVGDCTIQNTVSVQFCTVPIYLNQLTITAPTDFATTGNLVYVNGSTNVRMDLCTLVGNGGKCLCVEASSGIYMRSCKASHFDYVIMAASASVVSVAGQEADYQNNTKGVYVWNGGAVMLCGTLNLLGGSAHLKSGGMIVKADGTLL